LFLSSEDDDESDDDEDGWITPSNLRAAKESMVSEDVKTSQGQVEVACLTTDFAMQVCAWQPLPR
jgi:RNA-binding protein NOB1